MGEGEESSFSSPSLSKPRTPMKAKKQRTTWTRQNVGISRSVNGVFAQSQQSQNGS